MPAKITSSKKQIPPKAQQTPKGTASGKVRQKKESEKRKEGPTATRRNEAAPARQRTRAKASRPSTRSAAKSDGQRQSLTKAEIILGLLRRKDGASVVEMAKATGWQAHSVRGFLSGTVKKKLALPLNTEQGEGAARRYFIRAAS